MKWPERPNKRLYTVDQASLYLGRGVHGVRKLIWAGELPVVREDGTRRLFVDVKDLDLFVEKSKFIMSPEEKERWMPEPVKKKLEEKGLK